MERKKFSRSWNKSKLPKKQRKYRKNAMKHLRKSFVAVHLSKELRKKNKKRAIPVRKGDKVRVMRGQFKKKTGPVEKVDLKRIKVYVHGVEIIKKDGSKALYPLDPSNLMLIEPNMDDKKRKKSTGM